MNPSEQVDLIVVGSGVAGLAATLAAAERGKRVLLLTAGAPLSGSSWWAQGGIAAAVGRDDSPELHYEDTLAVGAGLNDRQAVEVLVREGRREMLGLIESGVPFDGKPGEPDLGLEAGHSRRRILHAGGGATGEMISEALLARARRNPCVCLRPDTPVDELLCERGRVVGVAAGRTHFTARAVLLATGGYAGLWARSTNPPGNRGVGLELAWQAGATLADLEFVQFHPTALAQPGAPTFLLSEALRGEGALLVDAVGREVVNPLLPRDVVARAIYRHMQQSGPVYLTLRHLEPEFVVERFPNIAHRLRELGLDLARDLLPVAPAAHYCMGGVRTDIDGWTGVPGLYAAGEVACTGAQGANRLASNSLLECLVFGRRAAIAATGPEVPSEERRVPSTEYRVLSEKLIGAGARHASLLREVWLGEMLDRRLGVERDDAGLRALLSELAGPSEGQGATGGLLAGLAARAALLRVESRGAHFRSDEPESHPEWRGRILWRRDMPPRFEEVR
ncbi:MAG: L-aspartate oxidase [Chloroflexia bacterium]